MGRASMELNRTRANANQDIRPNIVKRKFRSVPNLIRAQTMPNVSIILAITRVSVRPAIVDPIVRKTLTIAKIICARMAAHAWMASMIMCASVRTSIRANSAKEHQWWP